VFGYLSILLDNIEPLRHYAIAPRNAIRKPPIEITDFQSVIVFIAYMCNLSTDTRQLYFKFKPLVLLLY
jgi:hypothetical protein